MVEPRAFFSSLPGEHPPPELQQVFREAGFACQAMDLGSEILQAQTPLTVLWTGRSWKRGIARLTELSKPMRTLAVLVGETPSKRILSEIRRVGGLAGFPWPLPEWAPQGLMRAIERNHDPSDDSLVSALERLEVDRVKLPEELLDKTAQAAQRLTGSDLSLMMLGSPGAKAYVLSSDGDGYHLEPGAIVAERLGLPLDLISTVPVSIKVRPGPASTLVIPLMAQVPGIEGSFKRLNGAILLSWRAPFLPTALDFQRLDALSTVAKVAILRLSELALSASRQHILSKALAELSRFRGVDAPADFERSLRGILFAFAGCAGLVSLWARISESSRQMGNWISLPLHTAIPRPEEPDKEERSGPFEGHQGFWFFSRPFSGAPGFGQLIAVFDSQMAAESGKTRMQQLSENLFLATRLIRRTKDSLAMDRLSNLSEQDFALALTGKTVMDRLDADGTKIFVIERDPLGKKIRQIFSTLAETKRQTVRFKDEKKGFADWVLDNADWLLIPNRDLSPGQTGLVDERCETGRHGEQMLKARPEKDYAPDLEKEKLDQEKTMLFFPLASRGQVAGVLAVWRNSYPPFHRDLDVDSLTYLAPYVAAICQRHLRTTKALEQEKETADLAMELSGAKSLGDAYRAVARGVGRLAEAACAILLLHDAEDSASLWQSAFWQGAESSHSKCPHLPAIDVAKISLERWPEAVEKQWVDLLRGFRFRSVLVPPGEAPAFAVALFDAADDDAERLFFADDLLEHLARSYLQFAVRLLETHVSAFASRLLDKIGLPLDTAPEGPQRILESAAELLKEATNADAVIVYTGTPKHMYARFSVPENREVIGLDVVGESLTAASLEERVPKRILEVERTKQKIEHERLQEIAHHFGWKRIRSWLCCPIVHEKQCTGLIKFLTNEGGSVFGKDHEKIVRAVAERTALEMYKAGRRVVLEDLLNLSNELAGLMGADLGQSMVSRLLQWVKDRLLRPHCEVVLVSRLETGATLIKKATGSVTDAILDWLDVLSADWHVEEKTWTPNSLVLSPENGKTFSRAGHASAIRLPGTKLLGHLILLDEEPFEKDEIEAIRQAANYMAVLLNQEGERLREIQEMGRFRHAVIGPVQGVTSAAFLLATLAEKAGTEKPLVDKLRTRLNVEAQVIRLWRENQRFYQSENVQIKPRREPLKPVIERCLERFRDPLAERSIDLKLNWPYQGSLQAFFDADAIDLVLSNLLDNARKYSFRGQIVEVGAELHERNDEVAIWVEDVGHGLPLEADIFGLGTRFVKDRFRAIGGEGLGLAMSAAIVQAHNGRFAHTSSKIADGRSSDTTPHRVRFTFTLPLSWRPL